jgi:hypothetical protein
MYGVVQAGVHWGSWPPRTQPSVRAEAAQARSSGAGLHVATLLRSPAAERYRVRMREAEQRAREAWERHAH